jgi:hypothetical protein
VAVWASPQFEISSYESVAPPEMIYVERAGARRIDYDKFAQFAGMRTDVSGSASVESSRAPPSGADVEDAISSALASSMLDDAGFMAQLRGGGGGGGSNSPRVAADCPDDDAADDEEGQGSFIGGGLMAAIEDDSTCIWRR